MQESELQPAPEIGIDKELLRHQVDEIKSRRYKNSMAVLSKFKPDQLRTYTEEFAGEFGAQQPPEELYRIWEWLDANVSHLKIDEGEISWTARGLYNFYYRIGISDGLGERFFLAYLYGKAGEKLPAGDRDYKSLTTGSYESLQHTIAYVLKLAEVYHGAILRTSQVS